MTYVYRQSTNLALDHNTQLPSELVADKKGGKAVEISVSGRVKDASTNEPLVGCTVVLKGTQHGTNTDASGIRKGGDAASALADVNTVLPVLLPRLHLP